ncbi:MAG: hypothetical protein M3394_07300, partial [Actinomycetota bacterium]|nr:hypothetical protein [Actinomycetota bacterium]
ALTAGPAATNGVEHEASGPVARLLRRLARLPADVLRLITSGPSELLLTAGIWLLLWLPCCLGERRRSARRAVIERVWRAASV